MLKKYFFDTSAFLAIIKNEPSANAVIGLLDNLHNREKVTSVLVAYELYRGISPSGPKARSQKQILDAMLAGFTVKPLTNSQAMSGAKLYRHTKGFADALIGAQCIEGGFYLVTENIQDFERMPGLKIHRFN